MRISAALPPGVTALLFDEAAKRRRCEEMAVAAFEERGFSEVVLPILDYFEPYEALLTPQLRAELYRFVDRDGELLALRGDFTPMLARLLAPILDSLELPLRLFYRGDLVRYQQERPGRLREYYELGVDADQDVALQILTDVQGRAQSTQREETFTELYWFLLVGAAGLVCLGTVLLKERTQLWWQLVTAGVGASLVVS